jgi:hypothetical protein
VRQRLVHLRRCRVILNVAFVALLISLLIDAAYVFDDPDLLSLGVCAVVTAFTVYNRWRYRQLEEAIADAEAWLAEWGITDV